MIQRIYLIVFLLLASYTSFPQGRFITNQGTKIRINTRGTEDRREGQPLIVFESGYGTPMGHWDIILDGVSELGPWLAYDRPGIGASDPALVLFRIQMVLQDYALLRSED